MTRTLGEREEKTVKMSLMAAEVVEGVEVGEAEEAEGVEIDPHVQIDPHVAEVDMHSSSTSSVESDENASIPGGRRLGVVPGRDHRRDDGLINYHFDTLPREPEDNLPNCHQLANRCTDPDQRTYMNQNCFGTCSKLGADGRDVAENCAGMADLCPHACPHCAPEIAENIAKYCRGTCNLGSQGLGEQPSQQLGAAPMQSYRPPFSDTRYDRQYNGNFGHHYDRNVYVQPQHN
ncbi:hypothetical protein Ddc_15018 [Ditylenchus destructor]|nr:hypothetical protein Ddc_15018 [Ditylenchus destructor]